MKGRAERREEQTRIETKKQEYTKQMTFGSAEELFERKREERPIAVRNTYLRSRDAREDREQS